MRTLFYVPIIHTSADLGSLASDVNKIGIRDLGPDVWREYLKTVEGFWDSLAHYFEYDEWQAKIYQDGMMAEGEIGQRIVEEGIKTGSRNYELVSRLISRGAILMRTEGFNLLREERDRLLAMTQAKSITQKLLAYLKYKLLKNRLLNKRDRFIAQRIDETLNKGEKGILFIGAYHNVKKYLPSDIQIKEVKDVCKVREYQRLFPYSHRHKKRLEELAQYLISKAGV